MKKMLSILLAACLVMGIPFSAGAQTENDAGKSAELIVSSVEVNQGEGADITVSLAGNTGLAYLLMNVKFASDKMKLTFVPSKDVNKEFDGGGTWTFNAAENVIQWYANDNTDYNGDFLTLHFTLADDIVPGTTLPVSIEVEEALAYNDASGEDLVNVITQEGDISIHKHNLKKTEKVDATCTRQGNIEYWTCAGCGKIFSDEDGKTEITLPDTVIKETGHTLESTDAKKETCEEDGNIGYWKCSSCEKLFSDAAGTVEIKKSDIIISAKGHSLQKTNAVEADCVNAGNIAYWTCDNCGKIFADNAGTKEIDKADTVIKAKGHKLSYVNAKPHTDAIDGNIAYWACTECGKKFSDVNGVTELTDIIDPAPGLQCIELSDAKGSAGEEIEVSVTLLEHPGMAFLGFDLEYDESKLELLDIAPGNALEGQYTTNVSAKHMQWFANENSEGTGDVAILTFRLKDGIEEGTTNIAIKDIESYAVDDTSEELILHLLAKENTITIDNRVPGDVTGDGKVNGSDLLRLSRYLAKYNVTIKQTNADVTGDGKVNGSDLLRLSRYLAKYNVVLK